MRKIVTSHVYPPIPIRFYDWSAHYEGEEEAGNYGWGTTEAEAIQDFKDNCQEAHDERLGFTACSDCPPVGYPTDETRCEPCPRRPALTTGEA